VLAPTPNVQCLNIQTLGTFPPPTLRSFSSTSTNQPTAMYRLPYFTTQRQCELSERARLTNSDLHHPPSLSLSLPRFFISSSFPIRYDIQYGAHTSRGFTDIAAVNDGMSTKQSIISYKALRTVVANRKIRTKTTKVETLD